MDKKVSSKSAFKTAAIIPASIQQDRIPYSYQHELNVKEFCKIVNNKERGSQGLIRSLNS